MEQVIELLTEIRDLLKNKFHPIPKDLSTYYQELIQAENAYFTNREKMCKVINKTPNVKEICGKFGINSISQIYEIVQAFLKDRVHTTTNYESPDCFDPPRNSE